MCPVRSVTYVSGRSQSLTNNWVASALPQKATLADHKLTKGAGAFASNSGACNVPTLGAVDLYAMRLHSSRALICSLTMGPKSLTTGEA